MLCDILANFIRSHHVPVFNWAEYLTTNLYLVDSFIGLQTTGMVIGQIPYGDGWISVTDRPIPSHIVQSKLEFFNSVRKKNFVIFKIMPDDLLNGNDKLITDYILNDDSIFKIGLNREDTDNIIISTIVCGLTGVWHNIENQSTTVPDIEKKPTTAYAINDIVKKIIMHNTWLFYNHKLLNQIIWYDELHDLHIDEMGLHSFSKSIFLQSQLSHKERADKFVIDSKEFLECAEKLHKDIIPLVENVRKVSTYKDSWKY